MAGIRFKLYYGFFLLLVLPAIGLTQSDEALLESGKFYYERDDLDSAKYFYEAAYEVDGLELLALSGLINVSLLRAEFSSADSLIQLGQNFIQAQEVDTLALCKFKISKGEYFQKTSQLDQALQEHQEVMRMSENLADGQLIHAYSVFHTALTFERRAEYDSSFYYAKQAYPLFLQSLDTADLAFTGIYNGLAVCYQRTNHLKEAKKFYLKSKAIAEAKLGPISSDLAICLNNLSSISRSEENFREAITYSERALKIFSALKDEGGISGAYYALGIYHYYLGDYGRTKDYIEACIAIRERLYSANHYALIGPYEVLGIAYEESGDYQKTLFYLKKGREKIVANYPPNSLIEGYNYENTALAFKSNGQLDSALFYIKLAYSILARQLPENDYALAVHYFSYANILYQLDSLERSSAMLQQSNQIYEYLQLSYTSEYAQNLALQGLILAEKQQWELADAKFESALQCIRIPGEDTSSIAAFQLSPNALSLLNEYTGYLFQKYRETKQAAVLSRFEQYADFYLKISDKFRRQFTDPYTKSVLIKDNAEVYNRTIGIYNFLYRQTPKEAYLQAAYNFSEFGRTCLLRDLQDEKVQTYAGVPDSILQKELTLKQSVTKLNHQLLEQPDATQIKQDLFASEEALNAHIQQTFRDYPKYYQLKFNANVPSLASIQSSLVPGDNLIEYMQDDTAYYALVISSKTSDLIYLGNLQLVNETIKSWKEKVVSQDQQAIASAGHSLYQKLWKPLVDKLMGERVTIVPTGRLFYLNFETLPSDTTTLSYLIYDYNISYALSLTVLFGDKEATKEGPVLAIAPGFEDEIKQQYQGQLDTLDRVDEAYLNTVRQPWSLKLANSLKKQFADQVYLGASATEANIKANLHKGNILYFGTHAIADPADPMRSKLVLAKEIGVQKEDGYLHAYELYGLPLQAELAVLNACESGLGNLQKGEGMISLAYSLHYAGCQSTVMSLWKVDEKINTQITKDFLLYLNQGYSKSEALRQSKLDYLDAADPSLQHPFYWGGMVLMGSDGMVQFQSSNWKWFLALGVGALLLLAAYLFRANRGARHKTP